MAITYGARWAIYLLTGEHKTAAAVPAGIQPGLSVSHFKQKVLAYNGANADMVPALTRAAQEDMDPGIVAADFRAPLQNFSAESLRYSLNLDGGAYYDPGQGTCPSVGTTSKGFVVDHQKALITALLGARDPAAV